MQFDMMHCSTLASLWEPGFVLASVIWAILLAYLLHSWRWGDRSMTKVVAIVTFATPFAVRGIASFVEGFSSSTCALLGRWIWIAVPLAIPFVALPRLLPHVDRIAMTARVIIALTCLHAWWTVTLFRGSINEWTDASKFVGFETNMAVAPWFAFLGSAAMIVVYILLERRAKAETWRQWSVVRLQLLLALIALVAELRVATWQNVLNQELPSPLVTPIVVLVVALGAQAVLRYRALSERATLDAT